MFLKGVAGINSTRGTLACRSSSRIFTISRPRILIEAEVSVWLISGEFGRWTASLLNCVVVVLCSSLDTDELNVLDGTSGESIK